jgi:hypothetical protein
VGFRSLQGVQEFGLVSAELSGGLRHHPTTHFARVPESVGAPRSSRRGVACRERFRSVRLDFMDGPTMRPANGVEGTGNEGWECENFKADPQSPTPISFERDHLMPDYVLEGPKPARMYEVILPKKIGYYGKVEEVLEDLFDENAIRAIPFVQTSIARNRKLDPSFDEGAWVKTLCQASRGYSIYEMDGRYLSPKGPVDERVLVIRFIFHNPRHEDEIDPKTDFLAASLEVVNHLVAHRFAQELGIEQEIWFLEYTNPSLAIWRKKSEESHP